MKKKILKNRELLLGGRHLTFCVDIEVRLCYTIIVPKGTEREEEKMRAMGIVRRLDDLGRLVIPKEIRRALGWKECEPIELYVDKKNRTVVLKKYETEEEGRGMKRYCVRVEYSGFKKVWVEAEDADEAMDLASDEVDGMLPGSHENERIFGRSRTVGLGEGYCNCAGRRRSHSQGI